MIYITWPCIDYLFQNNITLFTKTLGILVFVCRIWIYSCNFDLSLFVMKMVTCKTSILEHSLGSASIEVKQTDLNFSKGFCNYHWRSFGIIKTVFACQKLISTLIGAVPPRIESFDGLIVPRNSYPLDIMVVGFFSCWCDFS